MPTERRWKITRPIDYEEEVVRLHKRGGYHDYEQLKEAWIAEHQDATPAEYTAAMREISRKLAL